MDIIDTNNLSASDERRPKRESQWLRVLMIGSTALLTVLWFSLGRGEDGYLLFMYIMCAPFVWWASWRMANPDPDRHLITKALSFCSTSFVLFCGLVSLVGLRDAPALLYLAHLAWTALMAGGAIWLRVKSMYEGRALNDFRYTMERRDSSDTSRLSDARRLRAERIARGVLERPSAPGEMTGYEPRELKSLPVPTGEFMHGTPGSGLSESGFNADAVRVGQMGELNFAKALAKRGLLDGFHSFWSVAMPTEYGGRDLDFQSDIDCVLVSGKRIWLLDMKQYTQGDVTWLTEFGELVCIDNPTGSQVGPVRKMSKNMSMAKDRFEAAFPDFDVRAYVVFMPGNNGIGKVNASWPGHVSAWPLNRMLSLLVSQHDDPNLVSATAVRRLTNLVKN